MESNQSFNYPGSFYPDTVTQPCFANALRTDGPLPGRSTYFTARPVPNGHNRRVRAYPAPGTPTGLSTTEPIENRSRFIAEQPIGQFATLFSFLGEFRFESLYRFL